MSAGQTTLNYKAIMIALYQKTNQNITTKFEVFTTDGWGRLYLIDDYFDDHRFFDYFITKSGLLFMSGGMHFDDNMTNAVATYNFKTKRLTRLPSMNVGRVFHGCQSILRNATSVK
jgi:hypothetical protein